MDRIELQIRLIVIHIIINTDDFIIVEKFIR